MIYLAACRQYLDEEVINFPDTPKHALLSEIRDYEKKMSEDSWSDAMTDEETRRFHSSLIKLRRYEYYARYGDFTQRLAHELRVAAAAAGTDLWENLSRSQPWSVISQKLMEEESQWKRWGTHHGTDKVSTSYAVYMACLTIGMDFDTMTSVIRVYGARNQALHNHLGTMLAKGNTLGVAMMIAADLNDLSSVIPIQLQDHETHMRAILIELRDRWFEVDMSDSLRPWIPKQAFLDEMRKSMDPSHELPRRRNWSDPWRKGPKIV